MIVLVMRFTSRLGKSIMDPQVRRWLIALIIGIALFVVGMASHYLRLF